MALGVVSIIIGLVGYGYEAENWIGWAAIVLGAARTACLARYLVGTYGSSFDWRDIVGFCLSIMGVIIGIWAFDVRCFLVPQPSPVFPNILRLICF